MKFTLRDFGSVSHPCQHPKSIVWKFRMFCTKFSLKGMLIWGMPCATSPYSLCLSVYPCSFDRYHKIQVCMCIYIYICKQETCMLRSQQSDHVNPGITPVIGPPQCHYLAHVHFRTTKIVVWCVDVVFGKKWSLPKIYGFFLRLFGFVAVFWHRVPD